MHDLTELIDKWKNSVLDLIEAETLINLLIDDKEWLEMEVDKSVFDARRKEASRLHMGISQLVKQGSLPGNGCDKTAERNGIILALNYIHAYGA